MAASIRLKDVTNKHWCYLSGETLGLSALQNGVTLEDLTETLAAFTRQSPSALSRKKAFIKEAVETFNNGAASCDSINKNNKKPKEGKQDD